MKLNEIKDPSDYQKGDETNPRSPHFVEPADDDYSDQKIKLSWEVEKYSGDIDLDIDVTVGTTMTPSKMDPEGESHYIEEFIITNVTAGGKKMSLSQAKSQIKGFDEKDPELRKAIADELSNKTKYRKFSGKVYEASDDIH
jgi:hypothetical protein